MCFYQPHHLVSRAEFTPGGQYLVTWSKTKESSSEDNSNLIVWDTHTGQVSQLLFIYLIILKTTKSRV